MPSMWANVLSDRFETLILFDNLIPDGRQLLLYLETKFPERESPGTLLITKRENPLAGSVVVSTTGSVVVSPFLAEFFFFFPEKEL